MSHDRGEAVAVAANGVGVRVDTDGDGTFDSRTRDDVWIVHDGVLRCGGRPAGYLKTKESFENYKLTLEWHFDPAAGQGNSGVLLYMTGEDKIWPRSIDAQLQHLSAGDFWNVGKVAMRADLEPADGIAVAPRIRRSARCGSGASTSSR